MEVTAADREKAAELVEQHDGVPWDLFQEHQWGSVAAIAAALAEERAKARAPFLRLADPANCGLMIPAAEVRRAASDPPEVRET